MSNHNSLLEAKVIAVVTIEDHNNATHIAESLLAGGVNHIEVTLRSSSALQSIQAIKEKIPEMRVGAGTVISTQQLIEARDAGAEFCFSPGFDPIVAKQAVENNIRYIPGVATASEIQQALSTGINTLKLFPAEVSGGAKLLSAFQGPFPQAIFCPTGGVKLSNMHEYLKLKNVYAVGGSWLVTKDIIAKQQWSEITNLAKQAIEEYNKCRS